jgi:glyoxylase-like metal-dependent hydrolase (beta-lactamase superfamily II)
VSYLHPASGTAFVGDTGGIRISGRDYLLPPTPPPDIELDTWRASVDRIGAWKPERLFLTHFGSSDGVERHLDEFRRRLAQWSEWVRASLSRPGDDAAHAAEFVQAVGADVRQHLPAPEAERFEQGAGLTFCWYGLARYWRKREAGGA